MPCLRHNSTTGMPASPSLSIVTIWLSVNLLFFKGVSDGKEAPKFYWLTSTLRGILRGQQRLFQSVTCSECLVQSWSAKTSILVFNKVIDSMHSEIRSSVWM